MTNIYRQPNLQIDNNNIGHIFHNLSELRLACYSIRKIAAAS